MPTDFRPSKTHPAANHLGSHPRTRSGSVSVESLPGEILGARINAHWMLDELYACAAAIPGMAPVLATATRWTSAVSGAAVTAKERVKLAFFGILFMVIMAIGNAFQIAALTMRPFSRKASAAVNSKVLAAVWGFIQFMLERRHRAIITFSGDVQHIPYNVQRVMPWNQRNDLPAAPSAFVVANHLFFCDFVLEHAVAIRRNMLGHCRYFSKESHKYWPLFGWLIRLAGFVLLKRDWEQDQAMIKYRIQQWKNDEQPIWMVVYPEGTRQTPEKLAASQAYSKKHDRPVFKHLLYPRTKGFISVVKQLRESHFQYVLDFTVACYHIPTKSVNTRFPSGFDLLSKRLDSTYRFHVHVDAHQLDSIPTDDEGTEQWLVDRWVEKDARLARWHQKWPRVVPGAANMLGHEDAMDVPWPWLKWQDFQREI